MKENKVSYFLIPHFVGLHHFMGQIWGSKGQILPFFAQNEKTLLNLKICKLINTLENIMKLLQKNCLHIRWTNSESFVMIVAFMRKLWSPKDDQNSAASFVFL